MILIHRLKKIKPNKATREILFEILFFVVFFALGVFFVFIKIKNRGERVLIIPKEDPAIVEKANIKQEEILQYKFVASSRGKYFYPVGSSRANSLSEQNKLYFDTEEEAKKLGFKPYIAN